MNKDWRMTEDEFYKWIRKYLDFKIEQFKDRLSGQPCTQYNYEARKLIRGFELTKDKYNINWYLDKARNIVIKDVDDWSYTSGCPATSIKELMLRAIYGKLYDFNYLAYCTLWINKNINEDAIEDLIYISSGLFSFKEWDDEHVKAVCDSAAKLIIPQEDERLIELYGIDRLNNLPKKPIVIKFNFSDYNGKLSREFLDRYSDYIRNEKLLSSEELEATTY